MECSICIEQLFTDEIFAVQPYKCNHKFHNKCIQKWDGNCPNCRALPKAEIMYWKKLEYTVMSDSAKQFLPEDYSCKNHDLIVAESGIPPFGAIIYCKNCSKQSCHNMDINYFIN